MLTVRQPKPRVEILTDTWTEDECDDMEHFASKWLNQFNRYFQLPVGRLETALENHEPWAMAIANILIDHVDAMVALRDGTHDLYIDLVYPEY